MRLLWLLAAALLPDCRSSSSEQELSRLCVSENPEAGGISGVGFEPPAAPQVIFKKYIDVIDGSAVSIAADGTVRILEEPAATRFTGVRLAIRDGGDLFVSYTLHESDGGAVSATTLLRCTRTQ